MIAADTSTWIAYLEGESGEDVELLHQSMADRVVLMPPPVLTEILSDPELPRAVKEAICGVPLIESEPGYWERAGLLRAQVLASRWNARLGDVLIAQSCIDRGIPLVTRDADFRALAAATDLVVALAARR